ncbi:hypothetical protein ANCCAN_17750 [Ancylostoma caninum]|uniref:Uncharacterized protein n=1 Tax=Ancylostoma caninum TaxID=29170 RepID=A0A368FY03_ANCCA|nr:hypothetical protein ANCCAN_17750 [Ancylostoma caninum]
MFSERGSASRRTSLRLRTISGLQGFHIFYALYMDLQHILWLCPTAGYGTADVRNYYSSNASPSYSKKLDENQSWASEPRRFEVYKTRAERDAERNILAPSAAPSYRPASYYSSASDRPLTNFATRKPEDSYKVDPYRAADSYRRYDDNYGGYKRTPYDFEKGATPGSDTYAPSAASHVTETNPLIMNRFRPTARRMDDRSSYIRTRSMDRKHPMGEEYDYGAHLRNGVPPEPIPDYTYVNYHDSSNGRAASVTKDEKGQPRSILKNKQSVDLEQRGGGGVPDESSAVGRSDQGNVGPVRSVIDRLRRHLSIEKSASPQRQAAPQQTMLGTSGTSRLTTNARESHDRAAEESPKKKRSLLSFNRRRTSELRMGSDGKLVTNGYDDLPNYKRPSSPIEKIKSLFRKNDTSHATSQLPSNDYYPGRYVHVLPYNTKYSIIRLSTASIWKIRECKSIITNCRDNAKYSILVRVAVGAFVGRLQD